MKRMHIIITGDVVGVGFRAWMRAHAREKQITGWVKNRSDGTVEAVLEGNPEAVDELIELSHMGPEIAWVDGVQATEEEPLSEFAEFEIHET